MKNNIYELNNKKVPIEEKGFKAKSLIDLDQPFDYDEVAVITGPEYVQNLRREGMFSVSYEELKRSYQDSFVSFVVEPRYRKVSGFQVADDYYYHIGHSWAHLEKDGIVRVGIDDFTARVFGPADTIALPAVGSTLKQGEVGWVLARNDHKAPMQAPVTGTVVDVNNSIKARSDMVNNDPYGRGWLFLMKPSNLESNLKELLRDDACFQWLEKDNQSLLEILGPRYERLAATGGEPINDLYGHFPEMDWDRLVKTFLRITKADEL